MRIAILCHSSAGGSGILATELAMGLSQKGHHVHIIGESAPFRLAEQESGQIYRNLGESPPSLSFWGQLYEVIRKSFMSRFVNKSEEIKSGSLQFHEILSFEYPLFDQASFPTLRAANTLAQLIDQHQIEVVNAHYVIPHATSAILARESGLNSKVITTLHGTDVTRVGPDPAYFYTTRHAINASDAVTSVCSFLADETKTNFAVTRQINVIPNWVDSNRFKRNSDPSIRAKYAQPDEQICIHISNFRPVKRSLEAVKVFAQISQKTPARLILVGEGPEKKACIDLAIELGVFGRVLSIGPVAAVEDILGIADIMFLTSEIEAFPLVLLEAMSSGVICLSTNVGGVSEMITHCENGFLFPVDSCNDMSKTALELFNDSILATKVRENARDTVVNRFSPAELIDKYCAIYEEVLGHQ